MAATVEETLDALDVSRLSPEIQGLIHRCMDGSEPHGPLAQYHVLKFSPMHVNIAVLRAAGFKGTEIAQITGATKQVVYTTLTHPYAKALRAALVPSNSARVIDIRTRIDEYAGELLDKVFGMALVSDSMEDVTKVTFGLLDRGGYAPKAAGAPGEVRDASGRGAVVPESTMSRLLSALEGSESIESQVMPTWVPRRPPEEALMGSASPDVGGQQRPDLADDDDSRGVSSQIPRAASGGGR